MRSGGGTPPWGSKPGSEAHPDPYWSVSVCARLSRRPPRQSLPHSNRLAGLVVSQTPSVRYKGGRLDPGGPKGSIAGSRPVLWRLLACRLGDDLVDEFVLGGRSSLPELIQQLTAEARVRHRVR